MADLSSHINKWSKKITQNSLLSDSLSVSIILTIILMIIVYINIINEVEIIYEDNNFPKIIGRIGIVFFIFVSIITFLFHNNIERKYHKMYRQDNMDIGAITDNRQEVIEPM